MVVRKKRKIRSETFILTKHLRDLMEISGKKTRDLAIGLRLSRSSVTRRLSGVYKIDVLELLVILRIVEHPLTLDELFSALKKKHHRHPKK